MNSGLLSSAPAACDFSEYTSIASTTIWKAVTKLSILSCGVTMRSTCWNSMAEDYSSAILPSTTRRHSSSR